jgi:hypothetical protein
MKNRECMSRSNRPWRARRCCSTPPANARGEQSAFPTPPGVGGLILEGWRNCRFHPSAGVGIRGRLTEHGGSGETAAAERGRTSSPGRPMARTPARPRPTASAPRAQRTTDNDPQAPRPAQGSHRQPRRTPHAPRPRRARRGAASSNDNPARMPRQNLRRTSDSNGGLWMTTPQTRCGVTTWNRSVPARQALDADVCRPLQTCLERTGPGTTSGGVEPRSCG